MKIIRLVLFILFLLLFLPKITFAQSNCPLSQASTKSNDELINNCSIAELSQLSNDRLSSFSLDFLSQFSNERLLLFSNDFLVKFPPNILKQFPEYRIRTFSCEVQLQLGYSCGSQNTNRTPEPTIIPPPISGSSSAIPAAPLIKKPVKIIISQFQRNDQIIDPSVPESVAKINLNFDQNGVANVRFQVNYDSSGQDVAIYYVQYKQKQVAPPTSTEPNEFLVDVIIHKSLTDQNEAVSWAQDTINNYVNTRFANAGIKQRIKVDKIISNWDDKTGCPAGGTATGYNNDFCEFSDPSKIRVWLYKDWPGHLGTSAGPHINQVWIEISAYTIAYDDERYKRALTHEIGHLFKMPDYYREDVYYFNNSVVPIGIAPYSKDIMWDNISYDFFSETSKGFADRTTSLPVGYGSTNWNLQYSPKNIILKITNDDNSPIVGAKVEVFPQSLTITSDGSLSLPYIISPNIVTINATTNVKGEINLGNYTNIFNHFIKTDNYNGVNTGSSAFIRVTNGDKMHYTAITLSYLNYLYFQGQTDTTTITKKFSDLAAYDPNKTTILSVQNPALSGDGSVTTGTPLTEEERRSLDEHIKEQLKQDVLSNPFPNSDLKPTPEPLKLKDFNGDGVINIFDYIEYGKKKAGL